MPTSGGRYERDCTPDVTRYLLRVYPPTAVCCLMSASNLPSSLQSSASCYRFRRRHHRLRLNVFFSWGCHLLMPDRGVSMRRQKWRQSRAVVAAKGQRDTRLRNSKCRCMSFSGSAPEACSSFREWPASVSNAVRLRSINTVRSSSPSSMSSAWYCCTTVALWARHVSPVAWLLYCANLKLHAGCLGNERSPAALLRMCDQLHTWHISAAYPPPR